MGIKDDRDTQRAMLKLMRETVTKIVEESDDPVVAANGRVLLLYENIRSIAYQIGSIAAAGGYSVEKGNTVAQYFACVVGGLKQFCEENDIALEKEEEDGI